MSEAARLADALDSWHMITLSDVQKSAAELRRLAAELADAKTECTALRATEQNLREELAECKAAYESQFKELHALKAGIDAVQQGNT